MKKNILSTTNLVIAALIVAGIISIAFPRLSLAKLELAVKDPSTITYDLVEECSSSLVLTAETKEEQLIQGNCYGILKAFEGR